MDINEGINALKPIAKHYKVRVFYSRKLEGIRGYTTGEKSMTISLKQNLTAERVITCFFHELGHIHCFRNNIWKSYHNCIKGENVSKVRRTALKAEIWIDKWAENEMKNWFPNVIYEGSYKSMSRYMARKWMNEHFLNKHYKKVISYDDQIKSKKDNIQN